MEASTSDRDGGVCSELPSPPRHGEYRGLGNRDGSRGVERYASHARLSYARSLHFVIPTPANRISLCHPDRSVRFAFPPPPLRRADAEWRDLLCLRSVARCRTVDPSAAFGRRRVLSSLRMTSLEA